VHDGTKTKNFLSVALGPTSPAQKVIQNELKHFNVGEEEIVIKEVSVWNGTINVLERRGVSAHSAFGNASEPELRRKIRQCKGFRPLKTWLTNSSSTSFDLYDLLVKQDNQGTSVREKQDITRKIAEKTQEMVLYGDDGVPEVDDDLQEAIDKAWRTMRDIISRREGKDRRTPLNVEQPAGNRRATREIDNITWNLAFTDGSVSADGTKAGWGVFIPASLPLPDVKKIRETPGQYSATTAYERVDGAQTNSRAELSAILVVLLKALRIPEANHLIVTDSQSSIDSITRFASMPAKDRLKTKHRDVLTQINDTKAMITGQVRFLHIYSHQDKLDRDNLTHQERLEKIRKQKELINNDALYEILIRGNEIADALASMATKKKTRTFDYLEGARKERPRNWAINPTIGTDDIYLTEQQDVEEGGVRTAWIDSNLNTWFKENTQTEILERRLKEAQRGHGERTRYLLFLDVIDKKRSFANASKSKPHLHADHSTLFKARMHALPTMAKRHRQGHQGRNEKLKKCFRIAYPDSYWAPHEEGKLMAAGVNHEDLDIFTTAYPLRRKTQCISSRVM